MPAPIKSYIDRVLTILAEVDDKVSDKKEIYKELAADGYDRAVASQVVGHLRKKAAKPGKFAEQSQLFDLYLADYERVGTPVATHTQHASHDPITGEVFDDVTAEGIALVRDRAGPVPSNLELVDGFGRYTTPHPVDHETVGRDAREPRPDVSSQPIQESPDATSSPLEDSGGCTSSAGTEGDKTGTPIQPETATTSTEQPIAAAEVTTPDANTHGQTGTAHHSGLAASGPANAEAVAKKVGQSEQEAAIELPVDTNLYAFTPKPLRPHCLRPLLCGGMGKDHCPSCQLAMAESERATA
jgi:uncharacterized protein (UPF0335 family)